MFKVFRKTIALLAIAFFCFTGLALAASSTDEAVLGADRWSVVSGGDLVPNANASYDIGSSSYRPDVTYLTTLNVSGTTTSTGALTTTGAIVANGAVTLGDAVTDINTVTGKIAGATPLTFDGTTANTVYTILAVDDPTSASKTVTLPAVTGTVKLTGAAVALTAGATPALTVAKGTTLYTDTITTDNEDQTITFSAGGAAGDEITIIFVTDTGGIADEVITFHGTLVRSVGTLTLANAAASRYVIRFISDGTKWNEVSRTALQAA